MTEGAAPLTRFGRFAPIGASLSCPRLSRGSGKTIEPKTRIKRCDDESTKRLSAVRTRGSQEAGRRSRGVEFAPDAPLEQAGFEPSVPRHCAAVHQGIRGCLRASGGELNPMATGALALAR